MFLQEFELMQQTLLRFTSSSDLAMIQYPPSAFTTFGPQSKKEAKDSSGPIIPSGDLYLSLRPFLCLGRVLGVLPISGLFLAKDNLGFGWPSLLLTLPMAFLLFSNMVLSGVQLASMFAQDAANGGINASALALAGREPIFYTTTFLIYTFFIFRRRSLLNLFQKWREVSRDVFEDGGADPSLRKDFAFYIVAIFGLGMVKNALYTLSHCTIAKNGGNSTMSPLESYFWSSHSFWSLLFPYHPLLTLTLVLVNTLAMYSWTYVDLFIILCSRALYMKFKLLVDQTMQSMQRESCTRLSCRLNWGKVRKEHLTLTKLLEEFETFLSPLIFLSYSANIFFICLEMHQGLTPQEEEDEGGGLLALAFSIATFTHLLAKVLTVSLTASRVHEYLHQISICGQTCATGDYDKELERLEGMLSNGPIGFTGLGCFVITKAFLLVVLSVVFTVEIVLLQASSSGGSTITTGVSIVTTPPPSITITQSILHLRSAHATV